MTRGGKESRETKERWKARERLEGRSEGESVDQESGVRLRQSFLVQRLLASLSFSLTHRRPFPSFASDALQTLDYVRLERQKLQEERQTREKEKEWQGKASEVIHGIAIDR